MKNHHFFVEIPLWDPHDPSIAPRLSGHAAGVTALTLRDELLASGAADNSTKLWNVARKPGICPLGQYNYDIIRTHTYVIYILYVYNMYIYIII